MFSVALDDVRVLEHATIKVPYETLNKRYRHAQKQIDRDSAQLLASVAELDRSSQSATTLDSLKRVLERAITLKRKARELRDDEIECLQAVKRRVDHLKEYDKSSLSKMEMWRRQRYERILVDFLFRTRCFETAQALAKATGIEHLVNSEIYLAGREIEESLIRRDVSKCLAWFNENKTKLKKNGSTLDFCIHLQEFIELVRNNRRSEAIVHARKYLNGSIPEQHVNEFQSAMGLLVLSQQSKKELNNDYQTLLDENRWTKLIEQFRLDMFKLNQMGQQSKFTAVLQSGLSALKTPTCFDKVSSVKNPNCPVCNVHLKTIAKVLPYAHCSVSKLICAQSREPINESNPPLMLPNGYVYGSKTLQAMAAINNGKVICPRTKETYDLTQAEKFKQRGYTDPELDRRTATTTGQMLYQIIDPRPTPVVLSDNVPPTPPPSSQIAALRRREVYNNHLSEHDNRNIIQNYGEYFGRGFGKRLIPQSARSHNDWILSHDPFPVHPDRSVTRRDYRGLPAFNDQQLSSSMLTPTHQKSSGNWMTSCYDDWGRNTERASSRLIYRDDSKRMSIYPWHY
ncbi:unnamed protein product [Rotaria sp. Silwood2]|nr:unnamed protein product [Rotaria sp. Silwood2]CAF2734701.1 unnamed protein product [Rotaria sp. Silwood2]CAF4128145.1 unnamed protein product [Rotaria sp. Silwood2]CAF4168124.1 unnamed protein product [Rotaria sp. Silwood2]CAF4272738.1 unnamed protein product [Rotaria sp. Silwood2]